MPPLLLYNPGKRKVYTVSYRLVIQVIAFPKSCKIYSRCFAYKSTFLAFFFSRKQNQKRNQPLYNRETLAETYENGHANGQKSTAVFDFIALAFTCIIDGLPCKIKNLSNEELPPELEEEPDDASPISSMISFNFFFQIWLSYAYIVCFSRLFFVCMFLHTISAAKGEGNFFESKFGNCCTNLNYTETSCKIPSNPLQTSN